LAIPLKRGSAHIRVQRYEIILIFQSVLQKKCVFFIFFLQIVPIYACLCQKNCLFFVKMSAIGTIFCCCRKSP